MDTVLLIESNKIFAKVISTMIEQNSHYKVIVASSIEETKELLNREEFFIILFDIKVGSNNLDFILSGNIPTIIMVETIDKNLINEFQDKPIFDYILKEKVEDIYNILNLINKLEQNKRIKVLIVDDSSFQRTLLKQFLSIHKFQILEAKNGKEALEIIKEHKDIKVLISDYHMPIMDGYELIKRVREDYSKKEMVILALSIDSDKVMTSNFLKNGANDYINKPFSKDELFSRIYLNLENLNLIEELNESLKEVRKNQKLLEEYKYIVDKASIVTKTDLDGIITYINSKFSEISGYSRDELVGKNHNIVRHSDMQKETFEELWNTINSKKIWQGRIKNRKKSGESYYVDSTIAPLLDENGEITEFIALRNDYTPLKIALDRAKEATKAKSKFLAHMSHEIRTPINGILGFLEILKNTNLDKKQREYLKIVDNSTHSLLGIINDILDFSKIESNKLTLEKIEFNPLTEFESVIELFGAKAKEKNIKLLSYISPTLPDKLIGDSLRIKQILTNLLSNAIKFTHDGGEIVVEIDTSCKIDEHNYQVYFSVKDNGIGISKDKQEAIFSDFEQADSSTTREFGGTGLGLSISKSLIELMGGEIKLYSREGNGSKFYFKLNFSTLCKNSSLEELTQKLHSIKIGIYSKESTITAILLKYLTLYKINTTLISEDSKTQNLNLIYIVDKIETENLNKLKDKYENCEFIFITDSNEPYLQKEFTKVIYLPLIGSKILDSILDSISTNEDIIEELPKESEKIDGKILVAEDNEVNKQLLEIILSDMGLEFKIVSNGMEAIESYKTLSFDLILMDINMPILDGIEATKEILKIQNEKNLSTPIIAFSANVLKEDIDSYLKIGMCDYILKPIERESFEKTLKKHLNKDEVLIDLNELSKIIGISKESVEQIVNIFFESTPKILKELKDAIKSSDFENIRILAHSLKNSCFNLRVEKLADMVLAIEEKAEKKLPIDLNSVGEIEKLFNKLNILK